jgi:hypothetical protein
MKFLLAALILIVLVLIFLFFQCGYAINGYLDVQYLPGMYLCEPESDDFSSLISGLSALMAAIVAYLGIKKTSN